jgi:Asp-tRNA(Asn)/Glu-tRNA(Gln) amidotransferase A subunit family amidase
VTARIPAAFCGVVGFKPSFGRVPYANAGGNRLARLGPLAATVREAAAVAAQAVRILAAQSNPVGPPPKAGRTDT